MWEPLFKVFYAESNNDGVDFAHTYDAPDTETAKKIAAKMGWKFCGELLEIDPIEDAMIERQFYSLH